MAEQDPMMKKLTSVQAQYGDDLLKKAHVVGVAVGLCKRGGKTTDKKCLVVLVDEKVPMAQLAPEDRIPQSIDGVDVDVQETGVLKAF